MDSTGLREVKDLRELGAVYPTDKDIQMRVQTSGAIKNIKKPIVSQNDTGTIHRKALDIQVQKNLREIKNPQVTANVRDKLELIEQELLYNNYDQAVDKIIETLKYLENFR